jgi:hypothetical protein
MKNFLTKHIAAIAAWLFVALAATSAKADVRWLETDHNFGAFAEDDGKVSTVFKAVNESNAPISIESVSSSCGCTVPTYSRKEIQPGDTAEVTVVYNPTSRPGRFNKVLKVKLSNDSITKLEIRGVVIGSQNTIRSRFPIGDGPIKLRNNILAFGTVYTNKIKSQYIDVYNTSNEPIKPTWSNIPKYLRITTVHDTIPPGETGVYSVVLSPSNKATYGLLTDSVTFNVPGQQPLKVEIAAIIEEDFSTLTEKQLADAPILELSADMIDLGNFSVNDGPITREFKITNKGKNELLLHRIYLDDKAVALEPAFSKLKKGKSGKVKVTFDPAQFSGSLLNDRIQIITNDPSHSLAIVRLVGIPDTNE